MADKKFSEFPVVTSPVLADITVVGLDALGQNAQFAGDVFSGGVSSHPALTDRDLADQHPIAAITDLQTELDGKEPVLGDPGTDGYLLSSTTAGVRSWVPPGSGGVTSLVGEVGDIGQVELRTIAGLYDPTQGTDATTGSGDDSIIVMVCPGNSEVGGWLGGDYPTPLTVNTNVYVWQAATSNTQTATWQNVDHAGTTSDPGIYQMLGYCGGNVATNWLFAANRLQEQTGKKVFCIVGYQGGAPSVLFDPVRGDTNTTYDFSGTYTSPNNMWYWISAAVNAAMTALRAGTDGAPIGGYPNKDFVDIVYGDIGVGDCVWAFDVPVYFPNTVWTIAEINANYPEAMQNFIDGAEGNSASAIGGWAKPWYTKWFFNDVPVGVDSTAGTVSIKDVFDGFTGNYTLINDCRSLVWGVSCPTGLLTASDTTLGTIDNVHWNSYSQAHIGAPVADAYLYQPLQRSRVAAGNWNDVFTADVDAAGFNITDLSRIQITAPNITAEPANPLIGLSGSVTVSGPLSDAKVYKGLRSSIAYTVNVPGSPVLGGAFLDRADTITAHTGTTLPAVLAIQDSAVFSSDSATVTNVFGQTFSAAFTPVVSTSGAGTITYGPNYPTTTVVEAATLGAGVTSAFHVGSMSRNVTHGGTITREVQKWYCDRTSATYNAAILIGGTLGTAPTFTADYAVYQSNTTPWLLNANVTIASGNLTVSTGGLTVTAGNITATAGSATIGTGAITSLAADGAGAVGFTLNTNSSYVGANAKLISVKNGGAEKAYLDKNGMLELQGEIHAVSFNSNYLGSGVALFAGGASLGTGIFNSGVANGGSAIGFNLNTNNAFTTTSKLLSLQNNSVEKAYVDNAGNLTAANINGANYYSSTGVHPSGVAASGSATGWNFNTQNALGGGDLLLNFQNNSSSKFSIDYAGVLRGVSTSSTDGQLTIKPNSAGNPGIKIRHYEFFGAKDIYLESLETDAAGRMVFLSNKASSATYSPFLFNTANAMAAGSNLFELCNNGGAPKFKISAEGMATTQGLSRATRAVSGTSDTMTIADSLVTYSSTSTVTATLPSAATYPGFDIIIKKTGASGTINVTSVSSQTFDGSAGPVAISTQYHILWLRSDGANWLKLKTGAP